MATVERPASHRGELGLLVDMADRQYATAALLITIGAPIVAYLSGSTTLLFYVHVALGAFWFGLDFFFKFVLGPALDASPDQAVGAVNANLVPKIVVVAEPLSVGVVGSGIGLAWRLGYFAEPTPWLYGALGIAALMLLNGFGPLHRATSKLVVELSLEEPDPGRLEAHFGTALRWGLLQSGFMLAILAMMVGLRGIL